MKTAGKIAVIILGIISLLFFLASCIGYHRDGYGIGDL
jgi:hypothetical protein